VLLLPLSNKRKPSEKAIVAWLCVCVFFLKIYDRDKDNQINKKELLAVLEMMVGDNIPNEQLTSIAERTINELDEDGDEAITFEEFCTTLEKIDVDEKMSMKFLA
jgi:Ca2+-binding EF-hand superfamily protein